MTRYAVFMVPPASGRRLFASSTERSMLGSSTLARVGTVRRDKQMQDSERWWHRFHYEDWVAREGLELIRGHRVDNVFTVPLRHWPRTDGYAVQIELDGSSEQAACYVQEIPRSEE